MALRLIEIVLPEKDAEEVRELLKEHKFLEYRSLQLLNGEVFVRILLDAEQNEGVLDILSKYRTIKEDNRVVILPVEATLPRAIEPPATEKNQKTQIRISREELYEDIKESARCTWVYLAMTALATIVAAAGLYNNNVAMIIGAMVIAPMLGSSMAMALGTTLGDLLMLRQALMTGLAGIVTVIILSAIIGVLVRVDPSIHEVMSRTTMGWGDIQVALASGCAGAIAFTTGVSATLIGVMVAVALLPPLVTSGLMAGAGYPVLAAGAWSLFLVNLVCVNIAAVAVFLLQGIHPLSWYEKDRAKKATRIAILLWVAILIGLCLLIVFFKKN